MKKATLINSLLILSAVFLFGLKTTSQEGIRIKRVLTEDATKIFSVKQTRVYKHITANEKKWNASFLRRVYYGEDMKDGTYTTIEKVNEFYVLKGTKESKILRSIIFDSNKLIKGFHEVARLKAKFSQPSETDLHIIDQNGLVYYPSEDPAKGNALDNNERQTVADFGMIDNLLLNLPQKLQMLGDEQEFNFRCLDHLWTLEPKDIYKKFGKVILKDVTNSNYGLLAIVKYDFTESVITTQTFTNEGQTIPSLRKECRIEALGTFDVSEGEWLDIYGTKKESDQFGTEGSEEKIEFKISRIDKIPISYLSLEDIIEKARKLHGGGEDIVFVEFFESGKGAHLKIENCDKTAPSYDEHKCYKNREIKMFLFEEQEQINYVLNQLDMNNCDCKKPEGFEDFETDLLPKWSYLVCLKECEVQD